jgi:hypothetical protein
MPPPHRSRPVDRRELCDRLLRSIKVREASLRIARCKVRPIRKAVLALARGFETGLDFFAYFFYQEKK